MNRNAVIELAVASEATKGVSGKVIDDQDGMFPAGMVRD
ncbi:hypothetical protein [Novosphingobium terrae]